MVHHLSINSSCLLSPGSSTSFPIYSASTTELDSLDTPEPLSPRTLYAQSFDRPASARSLPSRRFRKNMKDIIGYGETTEAEFDALPLAVRRKYFSTLERLRFAQNSRDAALNELPIQNHNRKRSLADRRGVNLELVTDARRKSSISRRKQQRVRQQSVSSTEASWFLTLPEKIKKRQFTREQQVILAANLRESVILDAADEAVYKARRKANHIPEPRSDSSMPPTPTSVQSEGKRDVKEGGVTSPYAAEYFRWMDEEEDLNLKLSLDDYHANLDGAVSPSPATGRGPSFRRQMSITKIPFGRSSLSSNTPRSPTIHEHPSDVRTRHKPRTLSLISPKQHNPKDSVISIDPNAAHYQDPEARLKLRVYLASPQKFDEAIEFGFPSMDGVAEGGANKENKAPRRMSKDVSLMKQSFSTEKSFLKDDAGSLFEDDVSMMDPDSPLTPFYEHGVRSHGAAGSAASRSGKNSEDRSHLGITQPTIVKQPDSYAQAMAGNREMTLRMTLTRPDLRADESVIYGWQTQALKSPRVESGSPMPDKYESRGPLGGFDGWGVDEKEDGVCKRLWNRVKSSQRKTA